MAGRRLAMGVLGLTLISGSLAMGCASSGAKADRMIFDKPGTAVAVQRRDENECLRNAITQDVDGKILLLFDVNRDAFEGCMRDRGYTPRPAR